MLSSRDLPECIGEDVDVRIVNANRLPGGAMQLLGVRVFDTGMIELRYEIRR